MRKGVLQIDQNEDNVEKLLNCLAVIMEDQLRSLCLKSIDDYMDCLINAEVRDTHLKQ